MRFLCNNVWLAPPLSVCADRISVPQSVSVGDKVMLPEYGGSKVELDNEEYHVFRDEDIVGILQ